jgi:hypothetical protein
VDEKVLRIALARFSAFRSHLPQLVSEKHVAEYHSIVDAVVTATGDDAPNQFKIPAEEVSFKQIGSRPGGFRGAGRHIIYSSEKRCDTGRFERQVNGLANYLDDQGFVSRKPTSLPATQPVHAGVYVKTMIGSAVQSGTSNSTINMIGDFKSAEFAAFIENFKKEVASLDLSKDQKNEVYNDIATVQVQLQSPRPKHVIIIECLKSIRSIVEGVAANVLTLALTRYIPQ